MQEKIFSEGFEYITDIEKDEIHDYLKLWMKFFLKKHPEWNYKRHYIIEKRDLIKKGDIYELERKTMGIKLTVEGEFEESLDLSID